MIADNLAHTNILVLDLETLYSADDCRACTLPKEVHPRIMIGAKDPHDWAPIGWEEKSQLGISIGCYWDYDDMALHWFDASSMATVIGLFVRRHPLLVSFNGILFDFPLMRGVLHAQKNPELETLCAQFKKDCAESYDILATIWSTYPAMRMIKGVCGLDALCVANDLPRKTMDGKTAPKAWREGHYAELIAYNVGDVLATKALFERIVVTEGMYILERTRARLWRKLPAPPALPAYIRAGSPRRHGYQPIA